MYFQWQSQWLELVKIFNQTFFLLYSSTIITFKRSNIWVHKDLVRSEYKWSVLLSHETWWAYSSFTLCYCKCCFQTRQFSHACNMIHSQPENTKKDSGIQEKQERGEGEGAPGAGLTGTSLRHFVQINLPWEVYLFLYKFIKVAILKVHLMKGTKLSSNRAALLNLNMLDLKINILVWYSQNGQM